MALVDIVRNAIGIANTVTKSLRVPVTYRAWIGADGRGRDEFASALTVMALVDQTVKEQQSATGRVVMTFAVLTILDPIADTTPNAGYTRDQPIDARDVFELPGGSTAPIVGVNGFLDAGTERGFYQEVTLGTVIRGD